MDQLGPGGPPTPIIDEKLGSAIHVISEEESLRAIEVARAECLRNRSLDGKPIQQLDFAIIMKVDFEFRKQAMRGNQDFCLAEFASAVCWPSTPGNHTVTMPCPHYVPGVRKHGQVSRRCFWSSSVDDATNGSVGHWRFSDVEFRDCLAVVESSSFNLAFSINVFRLVLVKMKSQTSCETSRVNCKVLIGWQDPKNVGVPDYMFMLI
ncbi:hypothetical protein X801_03405 [Opisthorchis viverrini]|uniref:G-protein coupled receptors family 2 profile 1 domain-containing protein n=1 Tax=Opisthorchis viverrini TaxID=6198 RepID=A0A1S8X1X4_OPIVI|nr:hypothetical protein X801_03405 [Opisthorchis viverrini]